MFLVSSCSCLCAIYWSQVLSGEWRCSWCNADRRCSNYIWVINNFCWGAPYIRGFTVIFVNMRCDTFTSYPGTISNKIIQYDWAQMSWLRNNVLQCSRKSLDRTCRTFPLARPKCLMIDFTNLNRIYKDHPTNVWWTMNVFWLRWCTCHI